MWLLLKGNLNNLKQHCKEVVTLQGTRSQHCHGELWHRGVVVITTAQLHSTKPEFRFCAGSNPVYGVSEIRDNESITQKKNHLHVILSYLIIPLV